MWSREIEECGHCLAEERRERVLEESMRFFNEGK